MGDLTLPGSLHPSSPLVARWLGRGLGFARPWTAFGVGAAYLVGDDVSDWQDVHWDQLPILDFYATKATGGTRNVQASFAANRVNAHDRGVVSLLYHFTDWGVARDEAHHFLDTVVPLGPLEAVVLDCEGSAFYADPAGCDPWIEEWWSVVEGATGRQPSQGVDYMSDAFARVMPSGTARRRLWVAAYGPPDPSGWGVGWGSGPWPQLSLWQWTSQGSLPGIAGGVDLDVAVPDLAAQLGLGPAPPIDEGIPWIMALSDQEQTNIYNAELTTAEILHSLTAPLGAGGNDHVSGARRLGQMLDRLASEAGIERPA